MVESEPSPIPSLEKTKLERGKHLGGSRHSVWQVLEWLLTHNPSSVPLKCCKGVGVGRGEEGCPPADGAWSCLASRGRT